jgi:hypothetical protein
MCNFASRIIKTFDIMPTNDNSNQVKISVPTEVEDGVYSNFAVITHSSAEFIIDFIRMLPNGGSPKVKSRVVMAPEHAKRLMYALSDNVAKYEKVNGPINLHDHRQGGSFPNPQGEA